MASLIFLGLAIICALISRILLLIAAIDISVWWALGVFLPFGPVFFRLNYPEQARTSYFFRVATLLCVFAFVIVGPAMNLGMHKAHLMTLFVPQPKQPFGYAMENLIVSQKRSATPVPTPSLEQRRVANATELERLDEIQQKLRLRKRDLLHSDTEGNRIYAVDLACYNDAVAKATAEKNALTSAK
jgi:hypothetical protein